MAGVVVHHNLIEKHTQTGSEKRREASSKLMLDDNAVLSGMFYAIALFGTHPRLHLDFFGLGDCQFASNHHQISTIWAILSYAEWVCQRDNEQAVMKILASSHGSINLVERAVCYYH